MDGEQEAQVLPVSKNIGDIMGMVEKQVSEVKQQIHKLTDVEKQKLGERIMAEVMTPMVVGGGDGLFGGGGGGGLIGGLILGSILRNGNLLGGEGGAAASQGGVQNVVNQSAIQQELADIKASIPFNEAQVQLALAGVQTALTNQIHATEASSALRDANAQLAVSSGFANQSLSLSNSLAAITRDVNAVGLGVERGVFTTTQAVQADGDKTRALITQQYEATLNRQLSDANATIIAMQNRNATSDATRSVEITTTNNINQMQQQQQQQAQFSQLAGLVYGLSQQIRSTNEAINVGSGTMNASPNNTNTNIR